MNPNVIMGGAILKIQPGGGCTTPQATSFLEVMTSLGSNPDGTMDVIGRSTGAADSNYRPFALYGDGIRLTLRPEACELVTWRCWEREQAPPVATSLWRRLWASLTRHSGRQGS